AVSYHEEFPMVVLALITLLNLAILAGNIALLLWHLRRRVDFQQETVALALQSVQKKYRAQKAFAQ
ncbi:hypothetical protein, partial [Sulfitobacter sp. HI0040]|uniref:hypothetical protein n=1 Tax=Sulfitobacter sp. HI0040 TaxID=1822232 RepID=UPI001F3C5D67